MSLAGSARRALNCGLGILGLRIERVFPEKDPEWVLQNLIQSKEPAAIFDIGANKGQFAKHCRKLGYRGWIYSFEPGTEAFSELKAEKSRDRKWLCFQVGMGAQERAVRLGVTENSESSSILSMKAAHLEAAPESKVVSWEDIKLITLDQWMIENLIQTDSIFLKIDVQGFEVEVLKGASKALEKTKILQVEMSLQPLYEGAPDFREIYDWAASHGFVSFSFLPNFVDRRSGQWLQVDGLFVRP